MMAKWMPPTPIEELFDQLREAQIFAVDAAISQEIMDGMLMISAYNNIKATGLFTLPCYTWNQINRRINRLTHFRYILPRQIEIVREKIQL